MAAEFVIALVLLTALLAGVAGYALARRGAPSRTQLDELQRELESAGQRAEEVQANVTGHFEQSALLFGQLARDYRAFLEHFSESAQALGISEVKARELLARADQPLLGQTDAVIEGESAARSEATTATPASEAPAAAASEAHEASVAATEATEMAPTAGSETSTRDPEPPLIEDIVETPAARPRVVDVEVDALGLPIEDGDRKRAEGGAGRD